MPNNRWLFVGKSNCLFGIVLVKEGKENLENAEYRKKKKKGINLESIWLGGKYL